MTDSVTTLFLGILVVSSDAHMAAGVAKLYMVDCMDKQIL